MLKRTSIEKLTALLMLPVTGQEQDWEIELADPNRIGEFLLLYERATLSTDDKIALMALLLASVDLYLQAESRLPDEWKSIAARLVEEYDIHREKLLYWACEDDGERGEGDDDDDDDPEGWFHLTPYIRSLRATN